MEMNLGFPNVFLQFTLKSYTTSGVKIIFSCVVFTVFMVFIHRMHEFACLLVLFHSLSYSISVFSHCHIRNNVHVVT